MYIKFLLVLYVIQGFISSYRLGMPTYFELVYSPNAAHDILKENFFDSFAVQNAKSTHKIYLSFFWKFIWTKFNIHIPEFLFIMMVSKDAIHYPTDILLIIIDSNFDLIVSSQHRINNEYFWKFFFEIYLEQVDSFLEFSTKISLESYGWSGRLFFWSIVSEGVFLHGMGVNLLKK